MPTTGTSAHDDPAGGTEEEDVGGDLAWICRTLGSEAIGASSGHPRTRSYLARPSVADPQLLIPLEPRAATRAGLRRVHDARSWRQRLTGLAAQAAGRSGLLSLTGGEPISLAPFPLVDHLAAALGEQELVAVIAIGPRRRNRKPVVQLVRPDGVVVGFAKLAWSGFTRELIANEALWLAAVDGRLPTGLRAPVVLIHETHELPHGPVEVVVTSPVPTPLRSHRHGPLPTPLVARLARCVGSERRTVADSGLIAAWGPLIGEAVDLGALLDRHGTRTVELGLWHGDLTPWNTATGRGPVSGVWDWEFASDGRPVGFDALHLAFESVRRRQGEMRAIGAVERRAGEILSAIPAGPAPGDVDTIVDLYLCELLSREARLRGQGWEPEHLGPLEPLLTGALARRLARSGAA